MCWRRFSVLGLPHLVGYAIVLTGIVSSATLANGFVGYKPAIYLPLPRTSAYSYSGGAHRFRSLYGGLGSLW